MVGSDWETSDLRWAPVDEVESDALLPAFAQSWPELRKLIEGQAALPIGRPDGYSAMLVYPPFRVPPALRGLSGPLTRTDFWGLGGLTGRGRVRVIGKH